MGLVRVLWIATRIYVGRNVFIGRRAAAAVAVASPLSKVKAMAGRRKCALGTRREEYTLETCIPTRVCGTKITMIMSSMLCRRRRWCCVLSACLLCNHVRR